MVDEELRIDKNRKNVGGGIASDAPAETAEIRNFRINPDTNRLEVDVINEDFFFGWLFMMLGIVIAVMYLDEIEDDLDDVVTNTGSVDTKFGEVQDAPTLNSLLGRLKAVEDVLGTIDTDTGDISGLITTLNALITSIKDTDGIKKITDIVIAAVTIVTSIPAGTNYIGKTKLTLDGITDISTETYEEDTSIKSNAGHHHLDEAVLIQDTVAATTGFMLVDLSDTTNWKHTNTGKIHVERIAISLIPTTAFTGKIYLAYLSNVDATNGDVNILKAWNFATKYSDVNEIFDLGVNGAYLECATDHRFGPILLNDVTFQTDVDLIGPDGGAAAYPSGNGDLVLYVVRTAGSVDIAVNIGYHTMA